MPVDAFRRARKLLAAHSGVVAAAKVWGVIHALLILAILAWSGLLLSLIFSKGVTRVTPSQIAVPPSGSVNAEHAARLPRWLTSRLPFSSRSDVYLTDTGLYPIVAE